MSERGAIDAVLAWKFPHGVVDEQIIRGYEALVRQHLSIAAPVIEAGVRERLAHEFKKRADTYGNDETPAGRAFLRAAEICHETTSPEKTPWAQRRLSDVLARAQVRQTCSACPSQWEGTTEDGRSVYVRYRWGNLTVGLGADGDAAVGAAISSPALAVELGDEFDGACTWGQVLAAADQAFDPQPNKEPPADESTGGRDTDTTPPDTTSSTAAGQKEKTNGRGTEYRRR